MRRTLLSILILIPLFFSGETSAQEVVPDPISSTFPNIRASLDDGFFVLAEQQARGVLVMEPEGEERVEATVLLCQALWGQKRYSEMLSTLQGKGPEPGYLYWRARAHFALREYDQTLAVLNLADESMAKSRYRPFALRLKGRSEQLSGDLKQAEITYKQYAADFPNNREINQNQFDLAEVYTAQGRIAEAVSVYEALAKGPNENAAARADLKLAHLLYTQDVMVDFDRSRSLFSALATNEQARLAYRIDAYVDLAALEQQAGDLDAAEAAMRSGISISPDARQRVPLKMTLARQLLNEGKSSEALKLLEECRTEAPTQEIATELQLEKSKALYLSKRYQEANEGYQVYLDVANSEGGMAEAYFGKALSLWALGRYAEAATFFDKAVKVLNDSGRRSEALFKAGDAYFKADKPEEAEKRYRAFITEYPASPNMPNALYQLGLSLMKIGRRSEALTTFGILETNHATSPFAEKAALRSADVMLANQEWDVALGKYRQIGATYTNAVTASLSLHQQGLVLYQLGRYAEAQAAFEGVIAQYPETEYVPQASYMRGFCLYLQGQTEEAVKTSETFIAEYPDSKWTPEVIFWLAEQFYNQGRYADAEALFLRISSEFQGHQLAPRALYWAGRAAGAQSNYVKAIERYSEVAKNYPESDILPQTRFAQGDALTELGEFARAILAFDEIIKNYPENYLVNAAWGRKGDCQFSLAVDNVSRYAEAMNSYQAILDRPSAPVALKLHVENKIAVCLEKTNFSDKAFSRYMNVVYTFINENVERSPYSVTWFTRSAFAAAAIKERQRAWLDAVQVYERVVEANVPAKEEALKRIEKIKKDNWLLFQESEEMTHVGTDG
ncbi:tetratricopeptide repeat protein [Pontiellaceae bacterium B12219]|nr:tetratricopeptide repeat protein [Pontiellaceae bacterium B12219]